MQESTFDMHMLLVQEPAEMIHTTEPNLAILVWGDRYLRMPELQKTVTRRAYT